MLTKYPFVSVIIPTCNRPVALQTCLAGLVQQDYAHLECIVIDNSPDARSSFDVVRGFPNVVYKHIDGVFGNPGVLRNIGVEASQGEILAFTDDDCVVPIRWISQLVSGYDHGVGGVGGRLVELGLIIVPDLPVGRLLPDGRVVGNWGRDTVERVEVQFLTAGNMSIRRTLFTQLGGFDPAFGSMGYEEVDLGLRAIAAGYRLLFEPMAWVEHKPAPRPDVVGDRSEPLKDPVAAFILSRNVTYLMARQYRFRWDRGYFHNVYGWWIREGLGRLVRKPCRTSVEMLLAIARGLIQGTSLGWHTQQSTGHMPVK